jgi:hypothetical protein
MGSYQKAASTPAENEVGFEDPNNAARPSYRLTPSTPAPGIRDAFDCRDIAVDFEADARPQPEGDRCDLGADEYRSGQ